MLVKNNPEKLFLILGKSASGKDSILKEILSQLDISNAISFTTRPMRMNEKNLVDYEFITTEDFKYKLINNEIAEHVTYDVINELGESDQWHYGLSMNQLTKAPYIATIVNPIGFKTLENMDEFKGKIVSILIETPNDKDRLLRMFGRDNITNQKCSEICRRYFADLEDFKDIICDYIVYNDGNFNDAVKQVKNIIIEEIVGDDKINE